MSHSYRYSKRYGYNDNYRGPEPKRGGGLEGFLRNANRLSKQIERQNRARQKELERVQRQAERGRITIEKEKIRLMQEDIIRDIEEKNLEISQQVEFLKKILEHTLSVDDTISFESLKVKEEYPPFSPPINLIKKYYPPSKTNFTVNPLNWFTRLIPGAEKRYGRKVREAEEKYNDAVKKSKKQEAERNAELEKLKKEYEEKKTVFLLDAQKHNQEVEKMRELYSKGDPDAILYYNELVLERSDYPDDFTHEFAVAYDIQEKTLRIEYKFPSVSIIPTFKELKYIKKDNQLKEIPRKDTEISNLYQDIIIAITLRSLHEIFEADQGSHISSIEFEGHSDLIDKATGQKIKLFLTTTKETFNKINLALIDRMKCFKEIGGKLSAK